MNKTECTGKKKTARFYFWGGGVFWEGGFVWVFGLAGVLGCVFFLFLEYVM